LVFDRIDEDDGCVGKLLENGLPMSSKSTTKLVDLAYATIII